MHGLNDAPEFVHPADPKYAGVVIPGTEPTQGVLVEKATQFRLEPSLVITNPEEVELATMNAGQGPDPVGPSTDFWTRKQLEQMYPATEVQVRMKSPPPVLSGLNAEEPKGVPSGGTGTLIKAALFAGAVLWLIGRSK
jgi:hypothetical protein